MLGLANLSRGNVNALIRLSAAAALIVVVFAAVVLSALGLPTPPETVYWALVTVIAGGEIANVGKRATYRPQAKGENNGADG